MPGRVWLGLLASVLCLLWAGGVEGGLKCGAATSNITPALGGSIVGGFKPFPATQIHDELHARCLVLDDGAKRLALVVVDLLGFHRCVSDEARRLIQEETGIPPECVLISATHTHSAVTALGKQRFEAEQKPDEYQAFVARRIADGVRRSINLLRPAELAFGVAEAPEHVFNRRWHLRPGTMPANPFGKIDLVKMNPPAGSPNLVDPAGPTDPAVSFLAVREPGGKPIGLYAAYSLHYVGGVGDGAVSADYFAIFCEELKRLQEGESQDPPFVALLANGTSGDINNINFKEPRPAKPPYEQMRNVAKDVAGKVHAALEGLSYSSEVGLDARYRELPIKTRRPTEEDLSWAKETLSKAPKEKEQWGLPEIYAERVQRLAENLEVVNLPIQALKIGDVGIATLPNEVFCEIGLEFKERSALQPSFMVSIAHGYFGYLPTPRHHDLGGYETWLGTNRVEREASVKMLEAVVEMTKEMRASP